jgi:hypothetical protein
MWVSTGVLAITYATIMSEGQPLHDAEMFFRTCSAGALSGPDFCFIFAPCGYDEPEILPS